MVGLQCLPVEILHQILDNLDAQTILFSFGRTCRRFRDVTRNYGRFILNFESISKSNFEKLCRLIDPHRVTSLIISENDETIDLIRIFRTHCNLRQFDRLRSLSLFVSEELQLKLIIQRFNIRSLESLKVKIEKSDDRRKTTTARLLSIIMNRSNLLKVDLTMREGRLEKIVWPKQHSIRYLKVEDDIQFDHMAKTINSLPHLQILIVRSIIIVDRKTITSSPFQHLKSLTLTKTNMKIECLEYFLSLTPSLVYLKLIGQGKYFDGTRWEKFIQLNLPLLRNFEFFFSQIRNSFDDYPTAETIIQCFQTKFWLEEKKWIVTSQYNFHAPNSFCIFTIPICISCLNYGYDQKPISIYSTIINNSYFTLNNISTIKLNFTNILKIEKQEISTQHCLFQMVKTLELDFGPMHYDNWTQFLSNIINLNSIRKIKISSIQIQKGDKKMLTEMSKLLQQTSNVISLDICFGFLSRRSNLDAEIIRSFIPIQIKHLAISIVNINQIKCILEYFQYLSSANFFFDYTPTSKDIGIWFDENIKGSTYQIDSFSVNIWLGERLKQMEHIENNNKRIKLTHDYSN